MFEETTVRGMEKKVEAAFRNDAQRGQAGSRAESEEGFERQEREQEGCIMRVCDGGLSLTLHVVSREPQRSEAESEVK